MEQINIHIFLNMFEQCTVGKEVYNGTITLKETDKDQNLFVEILNLKTNKTKKHTKKQKKKKKKKKILLKTIMHFLMVERVFVAFESKTFQIKNKGTCFSNLAMRDKVSGHSKLSRFNY